MLKYYFLIILILYGFSVKAQENESAETRYYLYTVKKGDTLYKIANHFDLGQDEILQSNPDEIIDSKKIHVGQKLILPTSHLLPNVEYDGIVINLAEPRLYFFLNDVINVSFPISIGADEKTPLGKTKIIEKREKPIWIPPASILQENPSLPKIVLPGPNNPLGNYALYLDDSKNFKWHNIMIHGTNVPSSIGARVSHGCIRLYPQDIEILFYNTTINTPVNIVNQPIKINEIEGKVYMEVHIREAPYLLPEKIDATKTICDKIPDCDKKISWQKVDEAIAQNLGIPVKISR